jgi:hypothetical protein
MDEKYGGGYRSICYSFTQIHRHMDEKYGGGNRSICFNRFVDEKYGDSRGWR